MSNTYDLHIDTKVIVVTPMSVQYLANFNNVTYQVVLGANNETYTITLADYNGIKALDYSSGGGATNAITSDTISNMEFADNKLKIDDVEFQGGSAMVYNTTTHVLSGAKDQSGNDVTFELGNVTITI